MLAHLLAHICRRRRRDGASYVQANVSATEAFSLAVSTLDNAADNAQVYTLADVDALIFAKNECTRLGLPDQKERVDEIIMRKYGCQDLAALRATLALESIGKLSSLMKHASCCRDNAIEGKSQFGISSRHFQNAVELLSRAESDLTGWVRGAVPKDARCWGSAGSKKFVFASGPEYDNHQAPVLAFAVAVCEGLGFHSVAGDAADQFHMAVMTAEGSVRGMLAQVADVSKPLQAVRSLVRAGHLVVFGDGEHGDDNCIYNKATGEQTAVTDDGINYLMGMWIIPPSEASQPFGRQ